ncbi:MAG: 4Fe-4S binding protein [Mycoplasmataceae bacterium]|jgi:ferredoxin|nr:4Fe-4S binding protein [Mycoplasmataceae bacterium]
MKSKINPKKCISCGACISVCPVDAISFDKNNKATVDKNKCIGCGACISVCPVGATSKE